MLFSLLTVVVAVALSTVSGAASHRGLAQRHAVHARNAHPVVAHPLQRRQSQKCRQRFASSSSSVAPSSSSQQAAATYSPVANPAADPTTSSTPTPKAKPTPSSTYQPPAPAPTTKSGGSSNNGIGNFLSGTNSGADLTYYSLGLTACGDYYSDNDYVAAISYKSFQSVPGATANPNNNPLCNRMIRVYYQGKSVDVKLVDECMGCEIADSLDLSPSAFKQLADPSAGRVHGISWHWI